VQCTYPSRWYPSCSDRSIQSDLYCIYFCLPKLWPPLWSSGQSSWLQIQRPGFYSRYYLIFWEVAGLERGSLSLVSTTEELLGRKSSSSLLENPEYGRRDPSRWPRGTLYQQKLALTSPTSSGLSRTETMEFFFLPKLYVGPLVP
jgi:hypothetical protein